MLAPDIIQLPAGSPPPDLHDTVLRYGGEQPGAQGEGAEGSGEEGERNLNQDLLGPAFQQDG